MGHRHIGPEILKYMEQNIRLNVYVNDIAKDLGLTTKQVTNAVYNLLKKDVPVVKVAHGVWRFDPSVTAQVKASDNGRADHMLFEMIGASKQGKFVLQDEAGDLYLAEKL